MAFDLLLDEFRKIAKEWVDSDYQHFNVEGLNEKLKGFLRHPPKNIAINDQNLIQLLMIASIQYGGNWFYWFEKGKSIEHTLRILVKTLSVSYQRVLYRVLYALQIFDQNDLNKEVDKVSDSLPDDVIEIINKFVNNKWVLDYLEFLVKSADEGTKTRATSVISEIKKYSPYDFPRKIQQSNKIFISYNHKDGDFVREIVNRFNKSNIGVIIDVDNLKFGENIQEFINISTKNTEFTLSIVSRNSLLSPWVILETLEALMYERVEKKKRYLPVIIDDTVLDTKFYREAKSIIEKGIRDLVELIYELSKGFNPTKSLENEKERLIELRNNYDRVIERLKSHLFIDFTTRDKMAENFPKLIEQIKSTLEEN